MSAGAPPAPSVAIGRSAASTAAAFDARLLGAAIGGGVALTALAVTILAGDGALGPSRVVPVLVASAGICAAALTRRSAPSLAWLATIGAALAASSVPIDAARGLDPALTGVGLWELAAGRSSIAAVVTLGIAAAYATRPRRRLDPFARPVAYGLFGWLVVACVVSLVAVAAGEPRDPAFTWIDVATAPVGLFLRVVAIVTALGVVGDVRAAATRAAARTRVADRDGAGSPRAERAVALGAATLRELWPGQADLDETTRTAERTRLAGDLHAVVLPSLRRAIAEAETGGDPDALARHLRTVDLELERLMADRWPVVLDAFGLVAALEDLAERIEADAGLKVEIDVEHAGERPPMAIERTAWRVAQVVLDNVVRHAAASTVTIAVRVDAGLVALAITDDGRGVDPGSGPARPGARGLADATHRAGAIGATIRLEPRPGGGTTVAFDWPAARQRG